MTASFPELYKNDLLKAIESVDLQKLVAEIHAHTQWSVASEIGQSVVFFL